jgi:hypothetical protein
MFLAGCAVRPIRKEITTWSVYYSSPLFAQGSPSSGTDYACVPGQNDYEALSSTVSWSPGGPAVRLRVSRRDPRRRLKSRETGRLRIQDGLRDLPPPVIYLVTLFDNLSLGLLERIGSLPQPAGRQDQRSDSGYVPPANGSLEVASPPELRRCLRSGL